MEGEQSRAHKLGIWSTSGDHDKKEGGCKKRPPAWVHWKGTQQVRERPELSQTTKKIIVEHLNSNLRMKHSHRCLSRGEMLLQVKEL